MELITSKPGQIKKTWKRSEVNSIQGRQNIQVHEAEKIKVNF